MTVNIITSILFLSGCVFVFAAGIGLLRLPDVLSRLHAGTKSAVLGTALALAADIVFFRQPTTLILSIGTIFFIFLTAPLAAHAIARRLMENDPALAPNKNPDDNPKDS